MKLKFEIIIGSILISASIILAALLIVNNQRKEDYQRFTVIPLNESNISVIDNETGKIYYKFISDSSGPTNWEEMVMPPK